MWWACVPCQGLEERAGKPEPDSGASLSGVSAVSPQSKPHFHSMAVQKIKHMGSEREHKRHSVH